MLDFVYWFGALIIAITIHEFAHAWTADRLGDPTPSLQGRLTLNPLAHLDPIGTIMLILVHFGWGKPVRFDPFNLRHPRRDAAIISIAGPAANLALALLCAFFLRVLFFSRLPIWQIGNISLISFLLGDFLKTLISFNVILAIFNLLPVHPLDGFKIVGGMLPEDKAREWYQLESYGMLFLLILLFPIFGGTAPVAQIISPIINLILSILLPAAPII